MTATQTAPELARTMVKPAASRTPGVARGFDVRRTVAVTLPAVTACLLVAAVATDPGSANEGREMVRVYAANIDRLQWHVLFLHLAYGAWGLVPIALGSLVRGRGRQLMNLAATLGFLVMVSMPGLMMSDMFAAAITNEHGLDAAMTLYDEMPADQWAIMSYLVPGLLSLLLVLPLTVAALARARRTSWWMLVPAFLVLPSFVVIGAAGAGVVVTAALLLGLSLALAKAVAAA